jgi:tripartite-type tricarboxylate transporter receptor subunit TctC
MPHRGGGKIRIVVVASAQRMPQMPEVPTVIENGIKDFTAGSFVGVLAPAKTPADIVATLEKALIKAVAEKSAQDKLNASGAEPVPPSLQTSKGFAEFIRQDYERSKEAARVAGLKPE